MQQGLAKKCAALIVLLCGLAGPLQAADSQAQLSGAEQSRYLDGLKKLYLTDNERSALLAHGNALLGTYALRAGYQLDRPAAERRDRLYHLSVPATGQLLVNETQGSAAQGNLQVSNSRLPVFGLDPFIRYECPATGITCVLANPADGRPWITIVRDHQGAAELAKALSFLLRSLQKH